MIMELVTHRCRVVSLATIAGIVLSPLQGLALDEKVRKPDLIDQIAFDGLEKEIARLQTTLNALKSTLDEARAENMALRSALAQVVASGKMRQEMVDEAEKRVAQAEKAANEAVARVRDADQSAKLKRDLEAAREELAEFRKRVETSQKITEKDKAEFQLLIEKQRNRLEETLQEQREKIGKAIEKCDDDVKNGVNAAIKAHTRKLDSDTLGRTVDGVLGALGDKIDGCAKGARQMLEDYENTDAAKEFFSQQAMAMAAALMAVNPAAAFALMAIVALLNMDGDSGGGGKSDDGSGSSAGTASGDEQPNGGDSGGGGRNEKTNGSSGGDGVLANAPGGNCSVKLVDGILTLVDRANPTRNMSITWQKIDWTDSDISTPPKAPNDARMEEPICDFKNNRFRFKFEGKCVLIAPDSVNSDTGMDMPPKAAYTVLGGSGCN